MMSPERSKTKQQMCWSQNVRWDHQLFADANLYVFGQIITQKWNSGHWPYPRSFGLYLSESLSGNVCRLRDIKAIWIIDLLLRDISVLSMTQKRRGPQTIMSQDSSRHHQLHCQSAQRRMIRSKEHLQHHQIDRIIPSFRLCACSLQPHKVLGYEKQAAP